MKPVFCSGNRKTQTKKKDAKKYVPKSVPKYT